MARSRSHVDNRRNRCEMNGQKLAGFHAFSADIECESRNWQADLTRTANSSFRFSINVNTIVSLFELKIIHKNDFKKWSLKNRVVVLFWFTLIWWWYSWRGKAYANRVCYLEWSLLDSILFQIFKFMIYLNKI